MGEDNRLKATWLQMMKQIPSAFDPAEARAQRSNEVLAPLPVKQNLAPVDPYVESSLSPRQMQAQAAFDAHMAEVARLKALAEPQQAMPPPQSTGEEPFDPNSYTTYKRTP